MTKRLEDIEEICETGDIGTVNEKLRNGWRLLDTNIYSKKTPRDVVDIKRNHGYSTVNEIVYYEFSERHYLLGKPKE